jgi:hypothetical protein
MVLCGTYNVGTCIHVCWGTNLTSYAHELTSPWSEHPDSVLEVLIYLQQTLSLLKWCVTLVWDGVVTPYGYASISLLGTWTSVPCASRPSATTKKTIWWLIPHSTSIKFHENRLYFINLFWAAMHHYLAQGVAKWPTLATLLRNIMECGMSDSKSFLLKPLPPPNWDAHVLILDLEP